MTFQAPRWEVIVGRNHEECYSVFSSLSGGGGVGFAGRISAELQQCSEQRMGSELFVLRGLVLRVRRHSQFQQWSKLHARPQLGPKRRQLFRG
jgi:hypothetical protein